MYEQGSAVCLDLFAYTKHRKDMQETMATGLRAEGGWRHRWEGRLVYSFKYFLLIYL